MTHRNRRPSRVIPRGFTLVELLVVIGILAILIALLMPALSKAQRQANTVRCAANMRSIMQAVGLYATTYKGAIPGSPFTSGAHVRFSGNPQEFIPASVRPIATDSNNTPGVVSMWDWVSPTAKMMGLKFNDGPTEADRRSRFIQFLQPNTPYMCPENNFLATAFGSNWGTLPVMSYTTSLDFMLVRNESGTTASNIVGQFVTRPEWNVPAGYFPNLVKVGSASDKVYLTEGMRFVDSNLAFTYNSGVTSVQMGGSHSDQRLYVAQSFNRSRLLYGKYADRNTSSTPSTARALLLAYRHGARTIGASRDAYRMNMAFFDGHVETVTIPQSLDPRYHSPRGTQVKLNSTQTYPLVYQLYNRNIQNSTNVNDKDFFIVP